MNTWTVEGYTEIKELGQGGSGRVMLAVHDLTGTLVAIKYLAEGLTGDVSFVNDFRSEASILAELDSPYITRLYEYLESDGRAAIVMELVDGVSMRSMIREQGAVEPEGALAVLKGSLLGLADAHRRKVVHRDYKPANVLVDTDGQSKLADFGLAVRAGQQGILAGTPTYMAPEQWVGASATPQTDIYAATATFFECLTGRPPFVVRGDRDLLRLMHETSPVPVDLAPEALRDLLRRGLAKDSKDRFRNAAAFLRELEEVARDNYGADWEAEGRRKLARRVLLLAVLLPRPTPQSSGASSSTAFAWTKLGRRATKVAAVAIVLAGIIVAQVALADQRPPVAVAHDAFVAMPPTLISPAPSAAPLPSPAPSHSVAAAATSAAPSTSHTKPAKKPPPPPPPPSNSPSPPPSPTPDPVPTFEALSVQGFVYSGTCTNACYRMRWTASTRAGGSGKATLHVSFHPLSVTGAPLADPSGQWDVGFTVTGAGPISWDSPGDYSETLEAACKDQSNVMVEATISVAGTTVISDNSAPVSCVILQ